MSFLHISTPFASPFASSPSHIRIDLAIEPRNTVSSLFDDNAYDPHSHGLFGYLSLFLCDLPNPFPTRP